MPRKPNAQITEETQVARARAAERMRRSRRRRGKGMRCFILELRDTELVELVHRGLLAPDQQSNPAAIRKAMYAFLDRYLGSST
jgi:hypothetical protein